MSDGERLEINVKTGIAKNVTNGFIIQDQPVPQLLVAIFEAGGLGPYTVQHVKLKRSAVSY